MRHLIKIIETSGTVYFWFHSTTRRSIPVNNHLLAVIEDPQSFGLDTSTIKEINDYFDGVGDTPPPGVSEDDDITIINKMMFDNGWVRLGGKGRGMSNVPYAQGKTARAVASAVLWMIAEGMIVNEVEVEINGTFMKLSGRSLDRFLR